MLGPLPPLSIWERDARAKDLGGLAARQRALRRHVKDRGVSGFGGAETGHSLRNILETLFFFFDHLDFNVQIAYMWGQREGR